MNASRSLVYVTTIYVNKREEENDTFPEKFILLNNVRPFFPTGKNESKSSDKNLSIQPSELATTSGNECAAEYFVYRLIYTSYLFSFTSLIDIFYTRENRTRTDPRNLASRFASRYRVRDRYKFYGGKSRRFYSINSKRVLASVPLRTFTNSS